MYNFISDREDWDKINNSHKIIITKEEVYTNDLVKRVMCIKDIDEELYIRLKTAIKIYSEKKNRN